MHTEKIKIFNEYAQASGFGDWWCLCFDYTVGLLTDDEFNLLVFEACDLVQKQLQLKILENQRKIFYKFFEEGKGNAPEIIIQANSNENAYKEAYSHLGPQTEDLFYQQLNDEETIMMHSNIVQ